MKRTHVVEGVLTALAVVALLVVVMVAPRHHTSRAPVIAPKPVADPFVYHRIGNARLVRAVAGGKLYIFLFRHVHGVWTLVGAKAVTELTS